MNGVLILLFKKKGERISLKNYRSLLFINIDYKIFTEILIRRLLQAFNEVIRVYQSAFILGRLINNNVRTIQYLIFKYKASDNRLAIIFLDQEKVYDRISYRFIQEALFRLGVPKEFISQLKTLYRKAKIKIFINGYESKEIKIRYRVRQGDSISYPFFVGIIEVLT